MDIIVLKPGATKAHISKIEKKLKTFGLGANVVIKGTERTIIGVKGDTSVVLPEQEDSIRAMEGVEEVMRIIKPFKLASREFRAANSSFSVRGNKIGGRKIQVIAGPCAVEGRDILIDIAKKVKRSGASFVRGGAFKPRTSPYSFQGMGEEGLKILKEAREKTGLPVVTELMDPRDMDVIQKYADIIQAFLDPSDRPVLIFVHGSELHLVRCRASDCSTGSIGNVS